jgi:hypothetical protein
MYEKERSCVCISPACGGGARAELAAVAAVAAPGEEVGISSKEHKIITERRRS